MKSGTPLVSLLSLAQQPESYAVNDLPSVQNHA